MTTTQSTEVVKPEKKSKKDKKEKKVKEVETTVQDVIVKDSPVKETKEERRARREAKRAAKTATAAQAASSSEAVLEPTEAGPSSLPPVESQSDSITVPEETEEEKRVKEERRKMKYEKKDKKRKAEVEVEAERLQIIADGLTSDESERKRRKKEKKERKQRESVIEGESTEQEEVKTSQMPEVEDSTVLGEAGEPNKKDKKKSKKDKKRANENLPAYSPSIPVDSTQPPLESTTQATSTTEDTQDGPPAEGVYADPSLSDTAKKAIGYCQQYAKSHGPEADPDSTWKFNKAKQIWLVRHIWDDTEVPDEYVDVIVGYLKTVQGGGRAGLIDTAKKQRDAVAPVTQVEPVLEDAGTAVESTESTGEKSEAEAPAAGEIKEDDEEKAKKEAEVKRKIEVAKARAIKLLKAMGAR